MVVVKFNNLKRRKFSHNFSFLLLLFKGFTVLKRLNNPLRSRIPRETAAAVVVVGAVSVPVGVLVVVLVVVVDIVIASGAVDRWREVKG